MEARPYIEPTPEEAQVLRKQAGRYLKNLREQAGLTQRELAIAVGFDYHTFISQLERGHGRIPPGQYVAFADALDVRLSDFVRTLVRYYDPITYYAIVEAADADKQSASVEGAETVVDSQNTDELSERVARLEALIAAKK
ncbi:helix-turn-helix transcriptional regulator [Devosia sp. SD17-2]|uniref:helix-turn-helix domain-containing protein n=1 Tax=Devosia sp. SD17-2 TaxID=2976459 RepID=UPI0031F32E52